MQILNPNEEFDNHFIESAQLLGIDSIDAALEFDGVLMKINYAIREIENLATRLAHWRKEKDSGREVAVFPDDGISLGPLAETIDLLRADYYVYSGYIKSTFCARMQPRKSLGHATWLTLRG